jgi:hypothetical protein
MQTTTLADEPQLVLAYAMYLQSACETPSENRDA